MIKQVPLDEAFRTIVAAASLELDNALKGFEDEPMPSRKGRLKDAANVVLRLGARIMVELEEC